MKQFFSGPAASILLFSLTCSAPKVLQAQQNGTDSAATVEVIRRSFYQYDQTLPMNAKLEELKESDDKLAEARTRYKLTYDSVHDQKVTSILAVPKKGQNPYPAVVLLAGSGGHKDSDYIRIAANMLSQMGIASVSLDAQYHGDRSRDQRTGDFHFIDKHTNRDAWVQTVIDLRRSVDYLQTRTDIDPKRIGYLGFSQGGMVGGTFLGVEPRIAAAILAVPGAGMVEWAKKSGRWVTEAGPALEQNANIVDPVHFIGSFSPRPLLILAATRDELIPKYATEALANAAKDPKEVIWYNAGHTLAEAIFLAVRDIQAFFKKHLIPARDSGLDKQANGNGKNRPQSYRN